MNPMRSALAAVLMMFAMTTAATAQPEKSQPARREGRDPTTPGPKLKEAMTTRQPATEGMLILRARIVVKGQPPAAMIELNGKTQTVTKGVPLPGSPYVVMEIDAQEVRIENKLTKKVQVLR